MLIWIQSFSVSISIQHFAGGAGQDRQKKEQRNKEERGRRGDDVSWVNDNHLSSLLVIVTDHLVKGVSFVTTV